MCVSIKSLLKREQHTSLSVKKTSPYDTWGNVCPSEPCGCLTECPSCGSLQLFILVTTMSFFFLPLLVTHVLNFLIDVTFQSSLRFTAKLRVRHRDFPSSCAPHTQPPSFHHPHLMGHLLQYVVEPTLTRHRHPESKIYIRVTVGAAESQD